jgi:molybdenum cofactor cytidylyltransferase
VQQSDKSSDIIGIVLGAGSSRRFGRPKQTLPLRNSTILGTSVTRACDSNLDRVVLVVGHVADEAVAGLEPGRATVTYNLGYGTGCASSLLAGLDAAEPCAAIVLLLGDMPGVTRDTIDTVIRAWREEQGPGAITSYRGRLGHPLLFSAEVFSELRTLHGDKAIWKFVDREPPDALRRVAVDADLPQDVDTWSDYLAVCSAFDFSPPAGLQQQSG